MESYSIVVLVFAALTLFTTLLLVRRRNQKQFAEHLAHEAETQNFTQIELIRVQNPTAQDQQAYALIETERQQVWTSLSLKTSISPRTLYDLSFDLIRDIAAIYYPETANPLLQVSVFDVLELNYRIIERVKEYLEEFPLNTIKDFNLADILRYKEYYDRFSDFKVVQLAKQHKYLYTIGKYAWMGYNAINPWYWGRQVVLTAGREGVFRYLLSVIITVVGEEAVLVYSKRNIRAKAVALEKNIAFEMIKLAVSDGVVSQEEYEVILNFILNNAHFDDQVRVTLLKALLHKRAVKVVIPPDGYTDKDKKRLLAEVERVAKADKLGILKKRAALKMLEDALEVTSPYRTQLELAPYAEVHSWDLMQQNRRREEAILRLMVQASAVEGEVPASLRDYIIQRAVCYPLPFTEAEQTALLAEETTPTPLDTLTNAIAGKTDRERALAEILDALLWYLPFTRKKEEFYTLTATALDLKKISEKVLLKRLEQILPTNKLIEKPPAELTKYLCRLLGPEEQLVALQETATRYTFLTGGNAPKQKETPFWMGVTTQRVLVLAVAPIDGAIYQHHLEFQDDLIVRIEPGKLYDTYILQGKSGEIRLENNLFRSANLKTALQPYLVKG